MLGSKDICSYIIQQILAGLLASGEQVFLLFVCEASNIRPLLLYEGQADSQLDDESPDFYRPLRAVVIILRPLEVAVHYILSAACICLCGRP